MINPFYITLEIFFYMQNPFAFIALIIKSKDQPSFITTNIQTCSDNYSCQWKVTGNSIFKCHFYEKKKFIWKMYSPTSPSPLHYRNTCLAFPPPSPNSRWPDFPTLKNVSAQTLLGNVNSLVANNLSHDDIWLTTSKPRSKIKRHTANTF